jgi:hypothetical protein
MKGLRNQLSPSHHEKLMEEDRHEYRIILILVPSSSPRAPANVTSLHSVGECNSRKGPCTWRNMCVYIAQPMDIDPYVPYKYPERMRKMR